MKSRILTLRIFGLVLFLNPMGIISLEAAAAFVENENSQINPTVAILVETILTLNHCRKIGKGLIRCCEQLLYIQLISHIETKKPIFNNLQYFSKKPLEIVKEKEWNDLSEEKWKTKLHGISQGEVKWKALWMRATSCLMSCGQRQWVPLIGITRYVSYAPILVVRQLGGI